jgi:hypothetical protein
MIYHIGTLLETEIDLQRLILSLGALMGTLSEIVS